MFSFRVRQPVGHGLARLGLCAAVALSFALPACKRSVQVSKARPADVTSASPRGVLCVEQADACLYCVGREGEAAFLETFQSQPRVCDPKDPEECVEFCSTLAPPCALPWTPEPHCVLDSELAFHRALFNRDTADRPEVPFSGRVTDEAGRRLEGVHVDIWVARGTQFTSLGDEVSAKDGTFKLHLRSGPWTYSLRLRRTGLASEIVDRLAPDKLAASSAAPARIFRMGAESVARGRVVDAETGASVADALLQAVRTPEDALEVSEARAGADGTFVLGGLEAHRYSLRVSKFGWKSVTTKNAFSAPAARLTVKLSHGTVIRGMVHNADGKPEPNATVAAVLSDVPGAPTLPIFWTTDSEGSFAQDHFAPGTYYLWARRGDMLAYPPEKIELVEMGDVTVELRLDHKGARVTGQVISKPGYHLSSDARAVLLGRAPSLGFPRPAVGALDQDGHFLVAGVLPGRYELSVREGTRTLTIAQGPRDVEVPIDPDTTVALPEPVVVRAQIAE
ncbi:MAG TPA: carboxypeptidase-like regulatory domain-containing protein [Polyangia bacterium]|nr:carboxypeptidase-like regulatory domain-containing protein [Polyangia bacterium]